MNGTARVIVVGAGVAGLSAAFRLQQQGFEVTVLEADDRVGGKTMASRRDGYILNRGATVLGASYDAVKALARDVGVEDDIVRVPSRVGIVRDGRTYWLRGGGFGALVDFIRTPLLSWKSKLVLTRAAFDALRARRKAGFGDPSLRAELDVESVSDYSDRRLNSEVRDIILDPVMGGLLIVDGLAASVADLFFLASNVLGGGVLGYRGGIDFLARAVARRLDVRISATVTQVTTDADGARVTWTENGEAREEQVSGVVLSVPAPLVPRLYPQLDSGLRELLDSIPQGNIVSLRFALDTRPDVDALLTLVPKSELGGLALVMFEHNLSSDVAPAGRGLIGVLLYHEWCTPRLELSDDELADATLCDLEHLVPGVTGQVEFTEVTRWTPGATRSEPGMHRRIAELDRAAAADQRVQLAGDYFNAPTVNGSVVSGERAAQRLAGWLSHESAVPRAERA
ncbi:MAG TPA: FAD-dependent oxidoreductase [Pseudonocardia sp.]|jgi:oxygen-dependent protoporphyrinogen oxidase|nr:FAD-dependent oxidoreductase [Pseudonocardia sp.]